MILNFDAFSVRVLQHFLAVHRHFRATGVHDTDLIINEVEAYLDSLKTQPAVSTPNIMYGVEHCPKCGKGPYITLPVNDSPATHVGGQWKSMKLCRNCHHEEWIK